MWALVCSISLGAVQFSAIGPTNWCPNHDFNLNNVRCDVQKKKEGESLTLYTQKVLNELAISIIRVSFSDLFFREKEVALPLQTINVYHFLSTQFSAHTSSISSTINLESFMIQLERHWNIYLEWDEDRKVNNFTRNNCWKHIAALRFLSVESWVLSRNTSPFGDGKQTKSEVEEERIFQEVNEKFEIVRARSVKMFILFIFLRSVKSLRWLWKQLTKQKRMLGDVKNWKVKSVLNSYLP